MSSSGAPPAGDQWLEAADWLTRARRLGPLRYSDLGPRRLRPPATTGAELEALAAWLAEAADGWWEAAGRPDPYTLVVASGDDGHLARAVLARRPACGPALRYVLVDPDQAGQSEPPPAMAALVALEEPAFLYPSAAQEEEADPAYDDLDLEFGEHPPARGIGPLATFLTDVPALGEAEGVVVAVRLLSRLPYDLYEHRDGEWCEVRVAAAGDDLVELTVPAGPSHPGPGDTPGAAPPPDPKPAEGARRRRLTGAGDWLRRILPTASAPAAALAVVDEWGPPGDTETVDLAQLRQVREPLHSRPQAISSTSLSVVTWRLG